MLIAAARRGGLLPSLAQRLEDNTVSQRLPEAVQRHYHSARLAQDKQRRDLDFEVSQLRPLFVDINQPLILLKGAAYISAGLSNAGGRLISDIDLITPAANISSVEKALNAGGWQGVEHSDYDDRYYRQWMHEIPPLRHSIRGSVLDLHHTILPPTSAPNIPAEALFEAAIEARPGVHTLGHEDMLLHSVAHLFFESEFHHGLRDLWDQRCLLEEFSNDGPQFWVRLVSRARLLQLTTPLWLSLRYVARYFEIYAPTEVVSDLTPKSVGFRVRYWDPLFARIFDEGAPEQRLPSHRMTLTLAYVRGHALRMPLRLLIPHLTRKALRSE